MPSSDSEDFESADEGHSNADKKERKKRLSSSNYSDSVQESDHGLHKTPTKATSSQKPAEKAETDGWDDFEVDEPEAIDAVGKAAKPLMDMDKPDKPSNEIEKDCKQSQDTGWDDFEEWGDEGFGNIQKEEPPKPSSKPPQPEPSIKQVADRMAPSSGGWGWSSLLSTASAGLTSITSQVSQGISTVLETGIGAPDPEELARQKAKEAKELKPKPEGEPRPAAEPTVEKPDAPAEELRSSGDAFQLGSLLSGVSKFVETTGTKVIAGGLDTLETIGKKTMEVLQDGDPGLAKKRAMLGLDSGDKPILSQLLREAKDKADEEDRVKDERREAKEVHYETLFDDFEGLVHLEALEMLSRQVSMRIEERIKTASPEKRQEMKETLQQVAELCEMPEEDDDDDGTSAGGKPDALRERLQTATQDLGIKLQFQPLLDHYTEVVEWSRAGEPPARAAYKRGVAALARATALAVLVYHKAAELLLTKTRRSTADEADALTQLTAALTRHVAELAALFTDKLNSTPSDDEEQLNTYITNIFLEAGNSSTYIQNAFHLALPILQIGAV